MAITFLIDIQLPQGVALGIPYILLVLLTLRADHDRTVVSVAAIATVLTVVGFVLSPAGSMATAALINRGLTIVAIWTVAVMVSRYRRQRTRLASSEMRAEAIVEACGDAILTFDGQGRVLSANPASARLFGRDAAEIASGPLAVILPGPLPEEGACFESEGLRADGSGFPVEVAVNTVIVDGREVRTAVCREITGRRMVEREVLRHGEEGRWRIGQELHEGLGQALTGTGILAGRLARQLRASGDPLAEEADRIAAAVRDADRQAKALSSALMPVELDEEGLHVAFHKLVRGIRDEHGVVAELDLNGARAPEDPIATAFLYQIVAQVVHGAVSEARASRVRIELRDDAQRLWATVRHDGVEPSGPGASGVVINQWARLIGANLQQEVRDEEVTTQVVLRREATNGQPVAAVA
jgi:two-component system, LuxR family, sensor kinase FixL